MQAFVKDTVGFEALRNEMNLGSIQDSLHGKVLVVDDKAEEIERVKAILGENIFVASDLASALEILQDNSDSIEYVLTDLFYPIGDLKEDTEGEFYQRFVDAYETIINECLGYLGSYTREMIEYVEDIPSGEVEFPSGILLSLFSVLEYGKISRIVSSDGHGNYKAEPIVTMLDRTGLNISEFRVKPNYSLVNMNSEKDWESCVRDLFLYDRGVHYLESRDEFVLDRDSINEHMNYYCGFEFVQNYNSWEGSIEVPCVELFRLAHDVQKYF